MSRVELLRKEIQLECEKNSYLQDIVQILKVFAMIVSIKLNYFIIHQVYLLVILNIPLQKMIFLTNQVIQMMQNFLYQKKQKN